MKRLYLLFGCILALSALILVHEPTPSHTITVTTELISTLLPHAHTARDTVQSPNHGVDTVSLPVEVPETMWVTEASIEVENAPFEVIHHLGLFRDIPNPYQGVIFMAGQDTLSSTHLPAPSGILLKKGERIFIDAMLHNPVPPLGEGGVYKDVRIRVTLKGVGEDEGRDTPLSFAQVQVADRGSEDTNHSIFRVSPHALHETKTSEENPPDGAPGSFTFSDDGWIVSMGAHMHAWQGAEHVDVYINGAHVRTFTSHLADKNIPWSYRTENGPVFIKVAKGDVLTVSATYSNPGEETIEGAMGMVGFFFTRTQPSSNQWWWTVQSWFYNAEDVF